MLSFVSDNITNTINTINDSLPFLVKCKTNNNKIHHLEHPNGDEFSLYAVIQSITSKAIHYNHSSEEKTQESTTAKNGPFDSPRKRFFDIEADFYFKDSHYGIDIHEKFSSLSSLARSMAIVLDCIKNNQLAQLLSLLNMIKSSQPAYQTCPLKYFVDKGMDFIANEDNKEDILKTFDGINNRKGLNGWSTILYKAKDGKWYVLDSLFDKDVRGGINFLSAQEEDERILLPQSYDLTSKTLHSNSHHRLQINPILFDNKKYFNKKGVYLPPKKTSKNIKKRKRKEYINHIIETFPQDNLEDDAISILSLLRNHFKKRKIAPNTTSLFENET